jgi:hypothetical protein
MTFATAIPRSTAALCTVVGILTLGNACTEKRPSEPAADAQLAAGISFSRHASDEQPSAEVNQELAALRTATARFHDIATAEASGWNVNFPPECLTHATMGGMGYHRMNPNLVDATVDPTEPELLVYEPEKNGSMRLVAVEYIIPFSVLPATSTPPVLFGRAMGQNEVYQVWALHAWVWKDNPNGTFENFDPKVSCQYAGEVRTFE